MKQNNVLSPLKLDKSYIMYSSCGIFVRGGRWGGGHTLFPGTHGHVASGHFLGQKPQAPGGPGQRIETWVFTLTSLPTENDPLGYCDRCDTFILSRVTGPKLMTVLWVSLVVPVTKWSFLSGEHQ